MGSAKDTFPRHLSIYKDVWWSRFCVHCLIAATTLAMKAQVSTKEAFPQKWMGCGNS